MEIDEAIEIVRYDPRWPEYYRIDAAEIAGGLEHRLAGLEHFGSTSIAGMMAKPVIDILLGPVQWPMTSHDRSALEALGYHYLGQAGVAGREYFRRRAAHDTNVAVVKWRGELWHDNLMLRDFLRANPALATAYSIAKKQAWSAGARTLLAYSAAKADTLTELLQRARQWNAGLQSGGEQH